MRRRARWRSSSPRAHRAAWCRPKLLLPWGDTTVLAATLAALRDGGVGRAVVVVAPDGPLRSWEPPPGAVLTVNPEPARGMLSSALSGMTAAGPADPLVVCPGDLPGLRATTVAALVAAYAGRRGVVVPRHGGKRGHPLLLSPTWAARVPELVTAERGLRQILELAAGVVTEVTVDDPGCVRDVDTPEAYDELRPRP
jgi:molybdenum cofactor cytidylyltransferase